MRAFKSALQPEARVKAEGMTCRRNKLKAMQADSDTFYEVLEMFRQPTLDTLFGLLGTSRWSLASLDG